MVSAIRRRTLILRVISLLAFITNSFASVSFIHDFNSTNVVVLSKDNISSLDNVPTDVDIKLFKLPLEGPFRFGIPLQEPPVNTTIFSSSSNTSNPVSSVDSTPPQLQISLSRYEVNASDGRVVLATLADPSTLLAFLTGALSYAESQARVVAKGDESNTYFRYTSRDYSLVYMVRHQTSLASSFSEWSYIYSCIALMRNQTLANSNQNTTWVASLRDPASRKTAELLVVPSIQDVVPPTDFPWQYYASINSTSDSATPSGTEDNSQGGGIFPLATTAGINLSILPTKLPNSGSTADAGHDEAYENDTESEGSGLNRRYMRHHHVEKSSAELDARANEIHFDRWNHLLNTGGHRFSLRRSTVTHIPRYLLYQLMVAAYDTLRADSGYSHGAYFAFSQLLPEAISNSIHQGGGSGSGSSSSAITLSSSDLSSIRFEFEISGFAALPKRILAELAYVLLEITRYNNWQERTDTTNALYGEVIDPQGHLVGRWTMGYVLEQLQPVLNALHCLPSVSTTGSCVIRGANT